jgi:hypothetical protein
LVTFSYSKKNNFDKNGFGYFLGDFLKTRLVTLIVAKHFMIWGSGCGTAEEKINKKEQARPTLKNDGKL